ncbi:MAG: polysaccharide biosynthesis tyrosine autokinase [Bdellovibrionales bacterium]|nr:polysaccharide biosynthesis tyrosine autokinase [Bdellovibrionales bacterium]
MTKHDPELGKTGKPTHEEKERWVTPVAPHTEANRYTSGYGYGTSYERSLKDYPLVLFRHWAVIVAMVVIGIVLALYQTSRTPRLYRSSAMIDIGSYVPPLEGPTSSNLREETNSGNYRNTQIRLLKSLTLAEKVIREHPEIYGFLTHGKTLPEESPIPVGILRGYLNLISFTPLDNTDLVMLFATSTDREMTAILTNAHADSFIHLVTERRQSAANINLAFLQEKYTDVTKKVEAAEKRRLEHAELNALGASSNKIIEQTFANKYEGLVERLNNAIFQKSSAEAEYREIRKSRGLGGTEAVGGGNITDRLIDLVQQERQYERLKKQLGNRNNSFLQSLKISVDTSREALRDYGRERVKMAKNAYQAAAEREQFLRNEFENLHTEQIALGKHKLKQDQLQQQVESLREVQESLSQRLEDAMINAESRQDTVVLIDKAYAPTYHISPNETSNLWTGCLLGGMLGVILAFLLDYLDNRVRSVTDLQTVTRTPVLGVIPQFSRDATKLSKGMAERQSPEPTDIIERDEVLDSPHVQSAEAGKVPTVNLSKASPILPFSAPFSSESESFRAVLATLTSSQGSPKRILVTSGQQGDGKTTLAVNLAATLAQLGERTLLIDADLRLPNIQSYFGLPKGTYGLTDFLERRAELKDLVIKGGIDDLFLLLAGTPTENPAALIRSEKMMKFLDAMGESFDYVIVDSPPVGPVADSLLMAQHVDGVAIVIRSGETSKEVAESAVGRLKQVGANVLGLVLNDTARMDNYWHSGYRYRRGSYYHYHRK